jgi:hypothetical protein
MFLDSVHMHATVPSRKGITTWSLNTQPRDACCAGNIFWRATNLETVEKSCTSSVLIRLQASDRSLPVKALGLNR